MKSLPEQLVTIRKALDLTQGQVAKRAGLSGPVLSRIESGKKEPRISEVIRIAEALGVRLELVGGDEEAKDASLLLTVPDEYRDRFAQYLERQIQEVRGGV